MGLGLGLGSGLGLGLGLEEGGGGHTASKVSSRARPGEMSSAARRSEMIGTAVLKHTRTTVGQKMRRRKLRRWPTRAMRAAVTTSTPVEIVGK